MRLEQWAGSGRFGEPFSTNRCANERYIVGPETPPPRRVLAYPVLYDLRDIGANRYSEWQALRQPVNRSQVPEKAKVGYIAGCIDNNDIRSDVGRKLVVTRE
ncbi:hypothetical protein GCM10023203_39700 [Actinomycetospora straminea]|uniref:Uncharacterized protein n=1 Tax=Actinomycetospora straminea TaxID=663607 RepID=A0ABP9EPE6_9PSEU